MVSSNVKEGPCMALRVGFEATQLFLFYQSCMIKRTIPCQLGQVLLFSVTSNRNTSIHGLVSQELPLPCDLQCKDEKLESCISPPCGKHHKPSWAKNPTLSLVFDRQHPKYKVEWEKSAAQNGAGCVRSRRCQLYPRLGKVFAEPVWGFHSKQEIKAGKKRARSDGQVE